MSRDELTLFCEVFQRRSFSAAARALGIDPSAASRGVASLEDRLGVALFARTTRQVVPTAAGERLHAGIAGALHTIAEVEQEVSLGGESLAGVVRIAAPAELGRTRIGPVAHAFRRAHPRVEIHLLLSDRRIDLVEHRVDVAIRVGRPSGPNLVVRRIGSSPQRVVASPAYLAERPPLSGGLAGHDLVLRTEDGAVQDYRDRLPDGESVGIAFVSDDLGGIADAVFAGLGISVLPAWLVDEAAERGELVRLHAFEPNMDPPPIFAVLPLGRQTTQRARAFLDALVEAWGSGSQCSTGTS